MNDTLEIREARTDEIALVQELIRLWFHFIPV